VITKFYVKFKTIEYYNNKKNIKDVLILVKSITEKTKCLSRLIKLIHLHFFGILILKVAFKILEVDTIYFCSESPKSAQLIGFSMTSNIVLSLFVQCQLSEFLKNLPKLN
jgi:hypothetical protein